jgi:predicted RND superfamily exporter protein
MKKNKFIDFIMISPGKSFILGMLLVVFFAAGIPRVKQNFSYRIWFQENGLDLKNFDQFEKQFGSDESAVVILHSPNGIFDLDSARTIQEMTEDFWHAPDVIRVDSLSNFNWTHAVGDDIEVEPLIPDEEEFFTPEILLKRREVAINHPSIKNYLVNDDGTIAVLYMQLKPFIGTTPDYEKITYGIRKVTDKYRGKFDHEFYITGGAVLNYSFKESTQNDLAFLVPMVMIMAVIFLALTLRSITGVILSLLIIVSAILLSMGSAGWLGIELNNCTAMVPQFMIAIGIADAVHILVTFLNYQKKGLNQRDAVETTLIKNIRPTLLTSFSTAFGFFSFATAGIPPIANMGIMAGIGTIMAWLVTYLLLGPLLLKIKYKKVGVKGESKDIFKATARSYKHADLIYKFRIPILIFFSIFCITSFSYILKIKVNSNPSAYFDETMNIRVSNNFMKKNVGGAMGAEIIVDAGEAEGIKDPKFLNTVNEYQLWLDDLPYISKTISIIDILKNTNKSLHGDKEEYYKLPQTRNEIAQQLFLYTMSLPQGMDLNDRMTVKNDRLKLTAIWTLSESEEILAFAAAARQKAKELGLNVDVTGKGLLWQTINEPVVHSFLRSFTIAIILISILLCFGLRSVKVGLLSMIPNTMPLVFGGALIALTGRYLDIGTVIVGSICLGIAVDDTIHFVTDFIKNINDGHNMRESMALIFTHTAPALIVTTIVLVVSFGTFVLGSFVPNQNFGFLVSSILTYAIIADLIFLPALLFVVGEDFFRKDKLC